MQKWEYKVMAYSLSAQGIELLEPDANTLDHLGLDGWELVSCVLTTKSCNADMVLMFFKRPIESISSRRATRSKALDQYVRVTNETHVDVDPDKSISRYFIMNDDGSKVEIDEDKLKLIEKSNNEYMKKHPEFKPEHPRVNVTIGGKSFDTSSNYQK